jgi:hypothetical protein
MHTTGGGAKTLTKKTRVLENFERIKENELTRVVISEPSRCSDGPEAPTQRQSREQLIAHLLTIAISYL